MAKIIAICFNILCFVFTICGQPSGSIGYVRNNVVDSLEHYLFVKESTGNNDGYWVEKMQKSVGAKKGDPWCGCYQGFGLIINGMQPPKVAARAASWFDSGHVIPNKKAQKGDYGSLYYRNLGRIGHIVAYMKPFNTPGNYVVTLEGNTSAEGSREGNRAAKRYRLKRTIHSSADWISGQEYKFWNHKCKQNGKLE